MMLTCKVCGKEWDRKSNRGKVPERCPECKHEAALAAARCSNEKRRELRERVREKQLGAAVVHGFCTCKKCKLTLPREMFYRDGKRQGYCQGCREIKQKGWGMTKCTRCEQVFPTDSYPLARTGRRRRRICAQCVAEDERIKEQERREEAEAEAFIAELMAKGEKKELAQKQREARMEESIREAEKRGMSYGKYQAMLRQRRLHEDKDMEKREGL